MADIRFIRTIKFYDGYKWFTMKEYKAVKAVHLRKYLDN